MGLAKYLHTSNVKLSNDMYKVNELLCQILCEKIWILPLIQLKQ